MNILNKETANKGLLLQDFFTLPFHKFVHKYDRYSISSYLRLKRGLSHRSAGEGIDDVPVFFTNV